MKQPIPYLQQKNTVFFIKLPLCKNPCLGRQTYCQIWPHAPLKNIRSFQLFPLWRLNALVIILFQDPSITNTWVSLFRQCTETNRVPGTQSISRVHSSKHPLHSNLTRFTHFALSCFVACSSVFNLFKDYGLISHCH